MKEVMNRFGIEIRLTGIYLGLWQSNSFLSDAPKTYIWILDTTDGNMSNG